MAEREFIVLYTHQKKKKAKVWQDGVLKIIDQGTKAVLIGEGNKRLDQVHIKANQAAIGEELESEKYLITIEENVSSDKPKPEDINLEKSQANQPDQRPHSHAPRRQPLKRKRTGFVPPRQVNKRPSPEKENPPKTQESQPLSTSSGLGSPRSSLFSTPCSKTEVSLQHGPNILYMYGRNRVKASQSNAHFAASELHVQQAMRYGTSSDPHKLEEDVGSESQEWSEDYNHGTLSRQNAATGYLAHPLTRTVMGEDLGEQQVGNQPGKSTEMRGTWDDLEGGSELSRTDSVSIKSSLSTDPSSSFQELRRTSSKQDSYRMHMYLSASSVKPGTNPDTVETRLTEEANDKTGDAFGAKRSTSRILALLGKGKKPFQPPLKQKSTQDTISHSSTGLMEDPSSQAILRPQGPVHVHQDNHQARIISSQPVMVEKDKFDEPLSYNTESQEPDISPTISRVFDEGNAGRTVASIRTSQHHCIPGEHGHMRLNTTSDQATEGNPTEAAAYGESSVYPESQTPRQNQHMKHGVIKRTGNVARNAPSLHLHHTQQYRTQGGIGKSGSQTQSGDGLTRGICGRERSEMRKGFRTPGSMTSNIGMCSELNFPAADTVHSGIVPQRKIVIPVSFPSVSSYKQILTEAVKEHLNILLHELSHRYHSTMEKADITSYIKTAHGGNAAQMSGKRGNPQEGGGNPPCKHDQPTKMVCVKKDGPNKGRMFYVCNNQRENQCKFFVWADQHDAQASQVPTHPSQTRAKISLHNAESIEKFARTNQIHLYCESQLSRRGSLNEGLLGSAPAWVKKYRAQKANNTTKKLYIKLHRKEHSSTYAKDDLWIISQDLTFDPSSSFVAKSMFHGPSSSNEIEIEPLTGYSPSNWSAEGSVYGILACNASSELTCLDNLQEYVNPRTFPILPHLISCEPERNPSFHGPAFVKPSRSHHLNLPALLVRELVEDTIRLYHLNPDQSSALQQVGSMVGGEDPPVTLIHGVFGAGKSYLLAVMVLLLVKLFKLSEDRESGGQENGWKVLIASTTNVAVDRILLGLLDLGFEDFIRVGSLRKIAKPVLPYSVHASDKENQEMKELQEMLKGDLTLSEKQHVRRSIERQRLGKNKEMLAKVKVIGVTCAACSFPCIKNLTFPVVLLDECSQMMEPSSLLPMARFGCEKLVLVGDPHQLDPTIQGSESAHKSGLEQTLFDRLSSMGYEPILLRTQYRCHPSISSLANTLFYDGQLLDGIIEEDRPPLLPNLPTLCFFNISHGREMSARDGSYFNDPEANFVVFLISSMMEMGISPADVGVITLYKAQVSRIRMLLQTSSTQNSSELKAIQISTVDAFQGGEKSIIILSCVRTQRVGFIDSDKRTNVALTRSKNHLLIVGGMKMLSDNLLWGEIVHKCQEIPDGIQDSKVFQKQWEERLRELKEDDDVKQERPQRTKAKRRKLERIEREHSPAMSLDSNDGDFVSSVSPSISCNTSDCTPVVSEMDCSEITRLHPTGTPHSCPEDDDLSHIDLDALQEDGELMSTARSKTDHVELPHSQEVLSTTAPVTFHSDPFACSPSSLSQEENDLPNIDLGTLPKDDHVKWDASRKESFISKEVVFLGEKREPTETAETSFSYSPLQDVVESDSESSEEDLPNFDIGNILL